MNINIKDSGKDVSPTPFKIYVKKALETWKRSERVWESRLMIITIYIHYRLLGCSAV
jgi:hypothetical protein